MPVILLLLFSVLVSAATAVVKPYTTQAVAVYKADDLTACAIDVRDSSGALVHDVDASLFSGAASDQRHPWNVNTTFRRVIFGTRSNDVALDTLRYSRYLQGNTLHTYTITCSVTTFTGYFTTTNPPLGLSHTDPPPVDPLNPGQYAYPTIPWASRNWSIVDLTGFLIKPLDSPRDAMEQQGTGIFASAPAATGWTNPTNVLADDASVASYSGSSTPQITLFVELGVAFQNSAAHSYLTSSANALVPSWNAWISSGGSPSAADRTVEFAVTVDGHAAATDWMPAVLPLCSASCTGAPQRGVLFATPLPALADWFGSRAGQSTIDSTNLSKRTGTVTVTGSVVTWASGDVFDVYTWNAGSTITISGTQYTIASIQHEQQLTVTGSPTSGAYIASNAGILVRKKSNSTDTVTVQWLGYSYETGRAAQQTASGDEDTDKNCAPSTVSGPGGEQGWHCLVSGGIIWIGATTGTVTRLGRAVPPFNPATPDGWNPLPCLDGGMWDYADPNALYCLVNSGLPHVAILKFVYSGSNTDIGDLNWIAPVVTCGSPPCWTITNLTTTVGTGQLDTQMAAFDPEWASGHFASINFSLYGRMGSANKLVVHARRWSLNDTSAWNFVFNPATGLIEAGAPTWRFAPWSSGHGPVNINDPNWIFVQAHPFSGPFTGLDYAAGNGPYLSTVTSGAIGAPGACPSQPGGNTLPNWPTGNKCTTFTVDGEPGDPTPFQYSTGSVTTTGSTVIGTGVFWSADMDGSQMQIAGVLRDFTYVSSTSGTLSGSPAGVTSSSYIMYVDRINNGAGDPNKSFLQAATIGDVFCLSPNGSPTCAAGNGSSIGYYYPTGDEVARLLIKSGNTWTAERGYAGTNPHTATTTLGANAWVVPIPRSCNFDVLYVCVQSAGFWNAIADPHDLNLTGTSNVLDTFEHGCCHSTRMNGVSADVGTSCAVIDGDTQNCYSARAQANTSMVPFLALPTYNVSLNPPFHGLVGAGSPNTVDTHPAHPQQTTGREYKWIADGRPLNGDAQGILTGNAGSPGVATGQRWKFTSAQLGRMRTRVLATAAACGSNPLLDISGPSSSLGTTNADNFKGCSALNANECVAGSSAGDYYANCSRVRFPYNNFAGVAVSDADSQVISVNDTGSRAMNVTQTDISHADPMGSGSRNVTSGFGRYKWQNVFWNAGGTPDGKWMFVWAPWAGGQRNAVFLAKLPPFPDQDSVNRGDFIQYPVPIGKPAVGAVTNAVVQYGYDSSFHCTQRGEACVAGTTAGVTYASDNPAGISCTSGCTATLPVLPDRVLFFQVLLRDAGNLVVQVNPMEIR